MSYIDIEQELDKITDNVKQALIKAGAIAVSGKVINNAEFNRIIDEKIDMCNAMRTEMEISGNRLDANSANLIGARIDFLRSVKAGASLTGRPAQDSGRENKTIEEIENKKDVNRFLNGIKNLFRKKTTPDMSRSK